MAGIRRKGVVLQERDRCLLAELGVMRIIDRETAKVVAGFGSTTRVNTRLLMLTRAGLLRRFFVGSIGAGRKAVYTLTPRGADCVAARLEGIHRPSGRLVVGDRFIEHQSAINEVYLALKFRPIPHPGVRLIRWRAFRRPLSDAAKLTPDGYAELETPQGIRTLFLEVDLGTESLGVWRAKVGQYLHLALSGEFQRLFRQPQFRVLVAAPSNARLQRLRSATAEQTDRIFRFATFEIINRQGLFSPVWLRPKGEQSLPLL
jgi:hypothetical protein